MQHQQSPRFVVAGEIDMATAAHLRRRLEEHVAASHGEIVVDCEGLTFIDSSGIKVLLDVAAFASTQGRRFVATNVHPHCRRTFQVAGIEGFLGIN